MMFLNKAALKETILDRVLVNRLLSLEDNSRSEFVKVRRDVQVLAIVDRSVNLSGFWVDMQALRVDRDGCLHMEANEWQQMSRKFNRAGKGKK